MDLCSTRKSALRSADWLHLTNEAYDAEKFGVRSLSRILKKGGFSGDFSCVIGEQIDDEVRHTRGYAKFVQKAGLPVSGFSGAVEQFVESLPSATLQLFVIQGLIEGINLGLLRHRLDGWQSYPSRDLEVLALEDELRHTRSSYEFIEELKYLDGLVTTNTFNLVTSRILHLFAKQTLCQNQEAFHSVAQEWPYAVTLSTNEQDVKGKTIARLAVTTMHNSRRSFLKTYAGERNAA